MEKCFTFFDKLRKIFQFFRQNAKSVLLFSTKCEKCLTFFRQNAKKCFIFFLQKVKSVYKMQYRLGNFLIVYSFSSVFPNFCAKINQIF